MAYGTLTLGRSELKIKLTDIIELTDPRGLLPGATLNTVAPWFGVPTGWTFPWTQPFAGSIEYGDLRLDLIVEDRDVIVASFAIALWETSVPCSGEPFRAPKPKPNFKRNSRVDMQGLRGGMSPTEVRHWLQQYDLHFSEFEQTNLVLEETWQIVANNNTLFSFGRGLAGPWLMDVVIVDKSHALLWPISDGVGDVRKVVGPL